MDDLKQRLRHYGEFHEEEQLSITASELMTTQVQARRSSRFHWRPTVAFAVAVAAVALIGLIPILLSQDQREPLDDPVPTTEVVPTTERQPSDEELRTTLPGLGTLIWTQIEGDSGSLPFGMDRGVDGGYFQADPGTGVLWYSEDGLSWTAQSAPPGVDPTSLALYDGWAVSNEQGQAWPRGATNLYRSVDGGWLEVSLPPAQTPPADGLEWGINVGAPVESHGVIVVPGWAVGFIAWESIYGLFEVDCGRPEPCQYPPTVRSGELGDAAFFSVANPSTSEQIAELQLTVEGTLLAFRDTSTGELVHVVTAPDPDQAELIAEQFAAAPGTTLTVPFVWVGDGVEFAYHQVPWTWAGRRITATPAVGFVYHDVAIDRSGPVQSVEHASVWVSQNGVDWVDLGSPDFALQDGIEWVDVFHHGEAFHATVKLAAGTERWISDDGVTWSRLDFWSQSGPDLPLLVTIEAMRFGWAATRIEGQGVALWVSTDLDSWHRVAAPEGADELLSSFTSFSIGAGAAGELIWVAAENVDTGARTLWIGRFES